MSGSTAAVRTTRFSFTQCYVSFGDPDGEDFAFTKCDADGTFTFTGLPDGDWRITVFDQWNDRWWTASRPRSRAEQRGTIGSWDDLRGATSGKQNIYTRTFFDQQRRRRLAG